MDATIAASIAQLEAAITRLKQALAAQPDVPSPSPAEAVMTATTLAKHLHVSQSYIYRHLMGLNPIPHHRIGRAVRFRLSEVERWLAER